ncbi:hypothetical protein [Dinoroseobacter sp. S375]|uniref:hypothetical protein n=1 Tax=Dinoroseobacter sp. S375 TaxID=3415136 RepID=UPI003C7A85C1
MNRPLRPVPKPIKRKKKPRRERQGLVDKPHVARVRRLPCWACYEYGMTQTTPTEAHHPIIGRLSQDRAPDVEAQPLCTHHHRGGDPNKIAIHIDPKGFVAAYGTEADGTAWAHRMIETGRFE